MDSISIDIETYSSESLLTGGVYRYTQAKDFEVLLFGYSVDGAEPQVVDLAGTDCSCRTLKEMLCVSEETVEMEGTQLTLPPFDIAVLGAE